MIVHDRDLPEGWRIGNGKSGMMTVHGESKKHVLRRFDKDGVIYTEPRPDEIYSYIPHAPERERTPIYPCGVKASL